MKKLIPLVSLMLLYFASSAQTNSYNSKLYSIAYPVGWEAVTEKSLDEGIFIFSPKNSSDFRANLQIVIEKNAKGNLKKNVNNLTKKLSESMKDFSEVKYEKVTIDGIKAYKVTYTGTLGVDKLLWETTTFIKENIMYSIIVSKKQEEPKSFNSEFDSIIDSFKFRK